MRLPRDSNSTVKSPPRKQNADELGIEWSSGTIDIL
jgi:hypothetical protein